MKKAVVIVLVAAVCLVLGVVLRCSAKFLSVVSPYIDSFTVCADLVSSATNHKKIASTVLSCLEKQEAGPFSLAVKASVIGAKLQVTSIRSIEGLPPERIVKTCVVDTLSRLEPQEVAPQKGFFEMHTIEVSKRMTGDFVVAAIAGCSRHVPDFRPASGTEREYVKPALAKAHVVGSPIEKDVYQQAFNRCDDTTRRAPDGEQQTLLLGFSLAETKKGWSCRPCLSESLGSRFLDCLCGVLVDHQSARDPSSRDQRADAGPADMHPAEETQPDGSMKVLDRERLWFVRRRARDRFVYYTFPMAANKLTASAHLEKCFER